MGRPSEYTQDKADLICSQIACGDSLRTVCKQESMPDVVTVYRWMRQHEDFRKQYAVAKEDCADALFEEMFDIADNASNDWMESNDENNPGFRLNGDHIQRSRLRVDIRKWALSKLKPKKYGDTLDLTSGHEKLPAIPAILEIRSVE
jgi:hypothetical protein